MHCKAKKNHCQGIMSCSCDCEECLEADRLAAEVAEGTGYEELEAPAVTEHFESQGAEQED